MLRFQWLTASAAAFVAINLPIATRAATEPALPPVEWFRTNDGSSLAYQRFGSGPRQLIFLMGGPGIDPTLARDVVMMLAAENEVVLFHQRGTGASYDATANPANLTIAGAVADLDALREALGGNALNLVGQSWGTMLAMAYAAAHRENVTSLALLNPGGPNLNFMNDFGRRVMSKLTPAERASYEKSSAVSWQQLRFELLGDVHDRTTIQPLLAELGPRSTNPRVYFNLMRDARTHYDVRAALRGFSEPVLLLFGDDDPSLAARDDLTLLFPNARTEMIRNAGHLGWLDQPAPYRNAVLSFTRMLPVGVAGTKRLPRAFAGNS